MIYTVLLNPTIDQILFIDDFSVGGTYKIGEQKRFPVGKAISVSLALKAIGIPSHVFALIGKDDIPEYLDFLGARKIPHTFIPINGKTRSNITLLDRIQNSATHLRFSGFTVTEQNLTDLNNLIEKNIKLDDIVVFSGSLPEGCPYDYLAEPATLVQAKGAKFILDTSGDPLRHIMEYNPYLIKGNLEEIGTILGQPLIDTQELDHSPTEDELIPLVEKSWALTNSQTIINIITLGKYGSIAFNQNEAYYSVLHLDYAPYTIGCGDSFLAGLLAGITKNKSLPDCLRLATACGAANTQSLGAGNIQKTDVDRFLPLVQLQMLEIPKKI